MILNILCGMALVAATVMIHGFGLLGLLRWSRRKGETLGGGAAPFVRVAYLMGVVLGLFCLHGLEIALYAVFYLAVGALSGMESALYFSASTFTTVGFGDVVLDADWRLVSAIESANGFLLIGWSTAFLVSVTERLVGED